jgi:hypothetical protein
VNTFRENRHWATAISNEAVEGTHHDGAQFYPRTTSYDEPVGWILLAGYIIYLIMTAAQTYAG